MTDLVRRDPTDTWVDLMGPVGQLATQIARTQFVPKAMQGQPASVAAAILTGREMGLGPLASLRGIHIVEGKPSLTAEMLAARILAAGHRIEWKQVTDERVTVRIERADGLSEAEVTWTMRDAQRAGLASKQVWRSYPRHMLRARAISEAAAMACPDIALGLDVSADPDAPQTRPMTTATVVQVGRVDTPEPPLGIIEVPEVVTNSELPPGVSKVKVGRVVEETRAEVEQNPDTGNALPTRDTTLITGPQMRKLGALIGAWETLHQQKLDRDERRHFIAELAEVDDLASAKDLTTEQASKAIDALQELLRAGALPDKQEGP